MSRHSSITLIAALLSSTVFLSAAAFAQQGATGTADEAKAMLTKTVAAVKADKPKALDMINKGEGGFRDRDLYPFCFETSDGKIVAVGNPALNLVGTDVQALKDPTGKQFGRDLLAAGKKQGQTTEVSYMFPKPGPDKTPVPKVSFVTGVGDLGCGVGYYR